MTLLNERNKQVLAKNVRNCDSYISQTIGLMFSRKRNDFALLFDFREEREIGLHMFFVFFPIDVLFLDRKRKVVDLKQNFEPWTAYYSPKKSRYVIEAAAGIIARTKTRLGDLIKF